MANRTFYGVQSRRHSDIVQSGQFTSNGASQPAAASILDDFASVTRTGVGAYDIVWDSKFKFFLATLAEYVIGTLGSTCHITAIDVAAGTCSIQIRDLDGAVVESTAETIGVGLLVANSALRK